MTPAVSTHTFYDVMDADNATLTSASNSSHYDEYIYEYEDEPLPLGEVIPVPLIYSATLLLGLVGNGLVIFSISYYGRMRTVTNVFLLSLATADLLLVLFCVPVKGVAFFSFTWDFGEALCRLVNYVQNYSMICSILTLTAISLERLVAVLFPLRAKYLCTMSHARLVVVLVWVISGILALPTIFIMHYKEVGVQIKAHYCIKNYEHPVWIVLYELYMFVLMFLAPVIVMVFAYSVIALKVWRVSDMRTGGVLTITPAESKQKVAPKIEESEQIYLGNGKQKSLRGSKGQAVTEEKETRKQVVLMLVLVVLLFVLCWGPILVNNILTAFQYLHYLHYGFLKPMRQAFHIMSYFNSCVNPIVYAFLSRNFRQSFKMAICACVKGRAFVRAYRFSISAASTRTSAVHTNGRALMTLVEKDGGSSGNEVSCPAMAYDTEQLELRKFSV